MASSPERVEALNRALWTYGRDSFLPHGTRDDGFAEDQPMFLTDQADYPNGATVLVLVDGAEAEPPPQFAPLPRTCSTATTRPRWPRRARCGGGCASAAES